MKLIWQAQDQAGTTTLRTKRCIGSGTARAGRLTGQTSRSNPQQSSKSSSALVVGSKDFLKGFHLAATRR